MEIIYSTDYSLIQLKIKRLVAPFKENVVTLSILDNSWAQIETALTTNGFNFDQKRTVVLQDAFFLATKTIPKGNNFDIKHFWKILNRLDPNLTVILTNVTSKLLKNWPKTINPTIYHLKPLNESQLETYLDKKLKPKLESEAIEYFIENLIGADLNQISNEIDKINHLFPENELVSRKQLQSAVFIPLNFDIFKMGSSFLDGDLNQFLQFWQSGFNQEANGQQLLGLLTNQLANLRWYYHYNSLGLTDLEIANHLKINAYYLKRLVAANTHQVSEINDRIKEIYSLNKKLLLGKIDKKIIPEYLFLKMFPQLSEREKNGANESL